MKIGQKEYKSKKDAIEYYKNILNAYEFGQSLIDSHMKDLIDLIDYHDSIQLDEDKPLVEGKTRNIAVNGQEINDVTKKIKDEVLINEVKVSKVQFSRKCFEIIYNNNTSKFISYIHKINNASKTPEILFTIACRNSIISDIRSVKQDYFDRNSVDGQVKCQETGILTKWTELVVDHRQPNTFSIIVDRFKELNKIEFDNIEYIYDEQNNITFKDNYWAEKFRMYHKEKASLRVVRKECNSSRTGMARVKRTSKDLTVK